MHSRSVPVGVQRLDHGRGAGAIFSLTNLADSLGMDTIWGEATASSAPFCEKVLQTRPVKDWFIIHRETMEWIQKNHLQKLRNKPLRKSRTRQVLTGVKRKLTASEWWNEIVE